MDAASSATVVFDLTLVALVDAADRPGMAPVLVVSPPPEAEQDRPTPTTKCTRIKALLAEGGAVADVAKLTGASKAHVYEIRSRMQRPAVNGPAAELALPPAPIQPPTVTVAPVQSREIPAAKIDDRAALRKPIRPGFCIGPARHCQWIEGDPTPDDSCKCLALSAPGLSYCRTHARRAYRVPGSPADFPILSPTP